MENHLNYTRVAEAIAYIQTHFKAQPSLDDVAKALNLSQFHFQRIFKEWVGISPKKYLQFISLEYAKSVLKEDQLTIFDAAFDTGLSGTGRLHDLFVNIEGMTPNEYKNGGINLTIKYSFGNSVFGKVILASTDKGLCHVMFSENEITAFDRLKSQFPEAKFSNESTVFHQEAIAFFELRTLENQTIKLHLKGTPFQLKIWAALLKIPSGDLSTYGTLANNIQQPGASRAVGTAIGKNPIAFLIPCHRVIQSSGAIGGYMWGSVRKTAIIGWEAANLYDIKDEII